MTNKIGLRSLRKIAYRTAEKGTTEKTGKSVLSLSNDITKLGFDSARVNDLHEKELQSKENDSMEI